MNGMLTALGREAVLLVLTISAPPLIAAFVTGLITGVLQAATQVQDPALPHVPRLVTVLAALALAGPWIGAQMSRFAVVCIELASHRVP